MKIKIANIIQSPFAIYHNEGIEIYKILEQALANNEKIEISFDGIKRCSTQFLNACIGKLYLLKEPQLVDHSISFDYSIHPPLLKAKIDEVRSNAISHKEYDSYIENATA